MDRTVSFSQEAALFTALVLDELRTAAQADLRRYDLYPADRRTLRILEDAVTTILRHLKMLSPKRIERVSAPAVYFVCCDGVSRHYFCHKKAHQVYEKEKAAGKNPEIFRGVMLYPEKVFYASPESAGEEYAKQRKIEVMRRKKDREKGKFESNIGKNAKFRVEK